jgi:cytochrome c oxidase assembly factor CtaG
MMSVHGWFDDAGPTTAVAMLAVSYVIAAARSRARDERAVTGWQVLWFLAGLATLGAALVSPLEPLSERLFSAHMTQHILLATVAPPLLVLGAPQFRVTRLAGAWRFATQPVVAWVLYATAIWIWHAPALYERSLRNDALHAVEHVTMLGAGICLWWGILRPRETGVEARRAARAVGIVTLFATALQTSALGALFALSRHVIYPTQSSAAGAWGMTPLDDQRLAGMLMWVPGGILYVIMMSVVFVAWLDGPGRRVRAAVGVGAGALGLTSCGRAEARMVPGGDVERGRAAIVAAGCGACHVVPGIPGAAGAVGPPLAGLAGRSIIGGVLPNTPDNMVAWLEDPPAFAPRTTMPNLGLAPQSARDIAAYLYSKR